MNIIYRLKIKTHPERMRPDTAKYITLFYDEDLEEVIKAMGEYDRKNGFTYTDRNGRLNTFADLIISKEEATGAVLDTRSYRFFYDHSGKRVKGAEQWG